MNKIYKTILNKTTSKSVVVSELAKGNGKLKNTCKALALSIVLSFGLSSPSLAEGNSQLDMMVALLGSVDGDAAKLVQKLGDYMGNPTYKLPDNINALLVEGDELINEQLNSYFTGGKIDLTSYKEKLNEIITAIDKANPNTTTSPVSGAVNQPTATTQPSTRASSQPSSPAPAGTTSQPSNSSSTVTTGNPITDLLKKMNDEMNNGGLTEETRGKAQELLVKLSQNQTTADQLVVNNSKYKTVASGAGTVSVAGAYALNDKNVSYDKSSQDDMANGKAEFSNLAVGPNSMVTKNGQVAVGVAANAYGAEVLDTGFRSTSIGYYANAIDTDSVAVGANAFGIGKNSTALGAKASTYGHRATALGSGALAYTDDSLAIGHNAVAGVDQKADEQKELNKLFLGVDETGAKVDASLASIVKKHNNLTDEQLIKINSLGFGQEKYNLELLSSIDVATDFADFPEDIKEVLTKLKEVSVKAMDKRKAISKSIAIGHGTASYGNKSVAVGNDNTIAGANTSVLGNGNKVEINTEANTNAAASEGNIAVVGNNNTVKAKSKNTVILGHNVTSELKNSVILGNKSDGSTAATASAKSQKLNGETHTFAGIPSEENGVVSVGVKDKERQIKHVAPGEISEVSTDAVNGSQLYSLFVKSNTGVGSIANKVSKLEGRIGNVEKQISQNRTEARSGIAGAAAIAGLPEIHVNGKSMVSVAGSNFKNQNAIAVGYTKLNDKGNLKFKLSGAATTNNDVITTIGLGYAW